MKVNLIQNINNKSFTAGYDKETRRILNSTRNIFYNFPETLSKDVLVVKDSQDTGLYKIVDGKQVCLSKFANDNMVLQIADTKTGIIDVFYHNVNDSSSDKFLKYKDKTMFPWFAGADEKLFSKRIKNMNSSELENIKKLLYKYVPEFFAEIKLLNPAGSLKKV